MGDDYSRRRPHSALGSLSAKEYLRKWKSEALSKKRISGIRVSEFWQRIMLAQGSKYARTRCRFLTQRAGAHRGRYAFDGPRRS